MPILSAQEKARDCLCLWHCFSGLRLALQLRDSVASIQSIRSVTLHACLVSIMWTLNALSSPWPRNDVGTILNDTEWMHQGAARLDADIKYEVTAS